MKQLYVAWQQPSSGEWIPVACLEQTVSGGYRLNYTQGACRASNFLPFSGLRRLDVVYESDALFPIFSNRLISKSRPEFSDNLRWLGLEKGSNDPMSILALTGGIRGTDSLELFRPPEMSKDGEYRLDFFARSLSFLPGETIALIDKLEEGANLFLMQDSQNRHDPYALTLRTENPIFLAGFCPKYYVKDLGKLLQGARSTLAVKVTCVNPDAPLNMRLRCTVSAKAPMDFSALSEEDDFKPFSELPTLLKNELTTLSALAT
ncbi:HIRAN domain-containing protein [Massilia rubra]|uniref:DNA-binding protein n=1 Tax=Massilia rubra TaxID=2607910 RepID=A0ABX0LQE9_9BURK|nr:HIRAN domain-containing protein [Massilia rubra]NHZ35050.1 DNA-binding protein [Massilia rubra]